MTRAPHWLGLGAVITSITTVSVMQSAVAPLLSLSLERQGVNSFWNGLLAGFSHAEIDTLIGLLTRLVMAAEARGGKKGRASLVISDAPILKSKKTKS